MAFQFLEQAVRYQVPVKIALIGPSGSGKTKSSLILCLGLEGKTVMIDTENKRGLAYADLYKYGYISFDQPFNPERYIEAMEYALSLKANNIIIDSASHEWIGQGGCLEIHSKTTQASNSKNSYVAWEKVTPRHNKFVDAIVRCPVNLILCLRGKDEYVLTGDDNKKAPKKVGIGAQMRDGLEYECTVTFIIDAESHMATVSKDFEGFFREPGLIVPEYGAKLKAWANSGSVKPTPPPPQPHTSPVPAANQPAAAQQTLCGFVTDVVSSTLPSGQIRFGVVINSLTFGTFDEKIADLARSLKGEMVDYKTMVRGGKSKTVEITWIAHRVVQPPPPATQTDQQASQPTANDGQQAELELPY